MRTYNCEICKRGIGAVHRTLSTEFPMIYSGEIDITGDLCEPCKTKLKKRLGLAVEDLKEETTA